jgi:hypothetical protein
MTPKCPRCGALVVVDRATFLMADNSRPRDPKQVRTGDSNRAR